MTSFEIYSSWFPWDRISGKPDSFNPIPHIHQIEDVNNLSNNLNQINNQITQINSNLNAISQYWDFDNQLGLSPNTSIQNLYNLDSLQFKRNVNPKIKYYDDLYESGIQSHTLYFRSNYDFAWYCRGEYSASRNDPGLNGKLNMVLKDTGRLGINGIQPETTLDVNGPIQTSFIQFKDRTQPPKPYVFRKYVGGFSTYLPVNAKNVFLIIDFLASSIIMKIAGKIFCYNAEILQEYNILLNIVAYTNGSFSVKFSTFYNICNYQEKIAELKCYKIVSENIRKNFLIIDTPNLNCYGIGWDLYAILNNRNVNLVFFEKWEPIDVSDLTLVPETPVYVSKPDTTIS